MPSTSRFRIATTLLVVALALVATSTGASATAEDAERRERTTTAHRFDRRIESIATGVVEGEIIGQRYRTTASGAQTESVVRVGDWHQGSGPDVITVVTEGGITNTGLIHNVSHQPALDVGAAVQLAVSDWGPWSFDKSFTVVGGTAGALDAVTGEHVASKVISAAELRPPYVLNGDAWIYPLDAPIEFQINPNTTDISGTAEANAINSAVATWEAASGIDFTYTGTNPITVADPNDFINTVFWAATPNPAHTFLAKASWYEYVSAPGEIVGFDVHFNTDHRWSTTNTTGRFDVESVALHEFGHSIGLDHTSNSGDVMFDSLPPNVMHRSLSAGDIAGAQFLYPDGTPPPTPTPTPRPAPTPTPTPTVRHTCLGTVATIVGTYGSDTLFGTSGRDVFVGLGGDDTIYGQGGDDLVCAGSGHDTVFGGPGNDEIYGQSGGDSLRGDDGNDQLFGGPGYDDLHGGNGADRLQAAGGNDTLRGGNGNDVLWGKPGNDLLFGDAGDDEIYGAAGDDVSFGGPGRDSIQGAAGNDELHGGTEDDVLFGQADHDELFGDAGNDTLYAAAGNDQLDGGEGADNLQGGGGNDTLTGGDGADILYGQGGTNTLNGGSGADQCFAGGPGSTMASC